jgi:hypothetical protein
MVTASLSLGIEHCVLDEVDAKEHQPACPRASPGPGPCESRTAHLKGGGACQRVMGEGVMQECQPCDSVNGGRER